VLLNFGDLQDTSSITIDVTRLIGKAIEIVVLTVIPPVPFFRTNLIKCFMVTLPTPEPVQCCLTSVWITKTHHKSAAIVIGS
jgi:hypothetical protein